MEYKLEYIINDELKVYFLNKEIVSVGKFASNDLVLKDNAISRKHFVFEKNYEGYKIVDQKSTNGIFVNGKRIVERQLQMGDDISVGRTHLKFIADEKEVNYSESDDQKISMVIPLMDDLIHKKNETIKREDLDLFTSLTDLGKELISSSSIENTFEKVADLIFDFIKPKHLYFFSYNEANDDLSLKYSKNKENKEVEKISISKTIAMKAINEKVAILSANPMDDKQFDGAESIILYGITSAFSIPIWTKDSIYGLIYADTSHFEQQFKKKDLEVLSVIANFSGLSIESITRFNDLNKERKVRSRLERYHSPNVVSRILEVGDSNTQELMLYKESEATVLFMDIVGFTTKVEHMNPVEVGILLNNFFTEMTDIVFKYNGTLDKYIGDSLMAVFGVPFEDKKHAESAVLVALDMISQLEVINEKLEKKDKIRIRIGINSGKLISGDFGSPKRLDYTVLGNNVNIASRLESSIAGKDEVIISNSTMKLTKGLFNTENLGKKKLHGISRMITSYKVLGKMEEL